MTEYYPMINASGIKRSAAATKLSNTPNIEAIRKPPLYLAIMTIFAIRDMIDAMKPVITVGAACSNPPPE